MIYYKSDYTERELLEIIAESNKNGFKVIDYEDHLDVIEGDTQRDVLLRELKECRSLLGSSDYICNKIVEAMLLGDTEKVEELKEKYLSLIGERESARKRIKEIGEELEHEQNS